MHVLVVEDDIELAAHIKSRLERSDRLVTLAHDGSSAIGRAAGGDYDVIILDRMLPGLSGSRSSMAFEAEVSEHRS